MTGFLALVLTSIIVLAAVLCIGSLFTLRDDVAFNQRSRP